MRRHDAVSSASSCVAPDDVALRIGAPASIVERTRAIGMTPTTKGRPTMRTLMKVSIPVESGNKSIKEGLLPKTVQEFVDRVKPEACYFGAEGGKRTAFLVFDLKDPTLIPTIAEPFF